MTNEAHRSAYPTFETTEESWFTERRTTRPSQRPTQPPPPSAPQLEDSIADGWFVDV